MKDLDRFRALFEELYGPGEEPRLFAAPGRVNLIGEHTDYNGGHVFPCAISLGTFALARKHSGGKVRLYSATFPGQRPREYSPRGLKYDEAAGWSNYPLGVLRILEDRGYPMDCGMDLLYWADLPAGAGLSSSASIEVLTAAVCRSLMDLDLDPVALALIAQKAENSFVGANCGIMDQFAVAMGKEGAAILLDCQTLKYRYCPLDLGDCEIVITNTNKPHKLSASQYNQRRSQCEAALADLRKLRPGLKSLGELTEAEFEELQQAIADPICRCRARHAVAENQRTLRAVAALEQGSLAAFGELMNQSHISLRDDYDVTGFELDTLAELAWRQEGVVGSRMTGGGFGGCTVTILRKDREEAFRAEVGRAYAQATGLQASFYTARTASGAREIL